MSYPILTTTTDSCNILNFKKGFPATIIIDQKGEIVFFASGGFDKPEKADFYFKKKIYPLLNKLLKGN